MELLNFEAEVEFGKAYIIKHTQAVGIWVVEGYASTSDLDAQNHIVSPEAIAMGAESLKKYDTVLFNHDPDRPIGKVLNSEALDNKLLIKVAISKTEPKIWEQIKDGTLSKFSIRGQITDSETYEDARTFKEIRIIKGMELHEVSLVSVPANPEAKSLSWYIEKALHQDKEKEVEKKVYRHEGESMSDCVSRKTKANMAEGMKQKQAVAVAISECKATKSMSETEIYDELLKFFLEKQDDDEDEISPIKEAIEELQEVSQLLKGEDKDQVMSIIRSLQALLGRIGKSVELEGGQIVEIKDEVKKEVVVEKKEDIVEKKVEKEIEKPLALDVSALRDVIVQLQSMCKDINSQSEVVKSTLGEVTKAKDEIAKMMADLNTVVKDIPIRKGQSQEREFEDRTKDTVVIKKSVVDSDEFKKAKPADQLHMLVQQAVNSN